MAEESDIRITQWPKEQLGLTHRFDGEDPLAVAVGFSSPIDVTVATDGKPIDVAMRMDVSAARPVPLCFSLCEPICAKSDYRIDISIFDQPVANILVRGLTRFFACGDDADTPVKPPTRELCADVERVKPTTDYPNGLAIAHQVRLSPLAGGTLRVVTFGDPAGRQKLAFPTSGLRIDLPSPAAQARLTLNSYAGMALDIRVIGAGGAVIESRSEAFSNEVRTLIFNRSGMIAFEVRGGQNESAFVELCFTPEA